MVSHYGTLGAHEEDAEIQQSRVTRKHLVGVATVVFMVLGAVAFSSGSSFVRMNSVVDANRNRMVTARIDPEVHELGMKCLNMTVNGLRWAIFGFNVKKDAIVALTAGPATNDWEKDFKMFTNALPENDCAVGVYNFEYWVSNTETNNEPLMITWAPKGIDPREEARAGYYLPGVILALNTDEGRINTEFMNTGLGEGTTSLGPKNDNIGKTKKGYEVYDHKGFSGPFRLDGISDTYHEFCTNEMGMLPHECDLEKDFHNCPFESEDPFDWTDANPCKHEVCAGDSFQNPEGALPGTISQACCDYIEKDFCADPANYETMGCHQVTLKAIDKLCEVPMPEEPVIVETTWSEEAQCKPECAQACNSFEDPNDTWRFCEGCRMDLMADENADNAGQISQCYPGALHYEMNTCCGNELTADGDFFCEQAENLSGEACNLLEYYECQWIPQADCPELKRAQDIADAPTGCCYMPNPDEEADLFGTTASFNFNEETEAWDFESGAMDEVIPSVLCGGGKYADADDTSVFAEGQTCAEVKAGFDQALADFEEAQRLAALAAATTPAARV